MSFAIERYKGAMDRAPIQTFLSMCDEIDRLQAGIQSLRAQNEQLKRMNVQQQTDIKWFQSQIDERPPVETIDINTEPNVFERVTDD